MTPILSKVLPSFDEFASTFATFKLNVAPTFLASQWRQTERAAYLAETLSMVPLNKKVDIGTMIEGELARPRRYMVTFDVSVLNNDTNMIDVERRRIYFMTWQSPDDYRAQYLNAILGDHPTYDKVIIDASFVNVIHNSNYKTY